MSLSAFLEVGIGLAFTYLLLSLIATWINEWIASILNLRAKDLKKAIGDILEDPTKVEELYKHPLIKALSKQKNGQVKRLPSYIPDRTFALAALDVLSENKALITETADEVSPLFESLPSGVRSAFDTFWWAGAKSIESLRSDVETWFNDKMARLSGEYKRRAQWISLAVGLVLAVGLNIDTITVADTLWRDPALRTGVVAYVEASAETFDPGKEEVDVPMDELRATLASLELPMGWGTYAPRASAMRGSAEAAGRDANLAVVTGWLITVVGWLLTGLAVSQGAPFWFDLLNKIVNLRSSGVVPKVEKEVKELKEVLEDKLREVREDLDDLKKELSSS